MLARERTERAAHTDHPTEHARRAELLHRREQPDAERRAGKPDSSEHGHVDPDLVVTRRSVPEHERHVPIPTYPAVSRVIGPNRSANRVISSAPTIAPTAMLPRIRPTSTPPPCSSSTTNATKSTTKKPWAIWPSPSISTSAADHRLAPDGTKPGAHTASPPARPLWRSVVIGLVSERTNAIATATARNVTPSIDDHGFDAAEADRDATER